VGKHGHTPEVPISTILDEPPSAFMRSRLSIQKVLTSGYRTVRQFGTKYSKRLPTVLPVLFFCFVFVAQWQEVHAVLGAKFAPLTYSDSQRIGFVLGDTLNLETLATAPTGPAFSHVALNVENIGGAGSTAPATGQDYVVKDGDTLSGIANANDLHSATLILSNPDLKDTEVIHSGQVLHVPTQDASTDQMQEVYSKQTERVATSQTSQKQTIQASMASVSYGSIPAMRQPIAFNYMSRGFTAYGPNRHTGQDLVAATGTPIYAAAAGYIIVMGSYGGWGGGYGNYVSIDHGGSVSTLYGHMSAYASGLAQGSYVSAGEVIGYCGSTGNSTGPHLHFEVRVNGTPVDPAPYW
jgi:hypothetical protein